MSDPPIICFWKWIGWKYYKVKKIVIWRVFLPKPKFFSHPPNTYPPYVPVGPTFAFHVAAHPELKKKPSSTPPRDSTRMARAPRAAAPPMLATTLLFASSWRTPCDLWPQPLAAWPSPFLAAAAAPTHVLQGWRTARTPREEHPRDHETWWKRLCYPRSAKSPTGRSSASASPPRRWSTRPWSSTTPTGPMAATARR
jgi:hypothetical protein